MSLPVFAWMTTPEITLKQRAFGATASLHGLMEPRGHRWPAGLPTEKGLQPELLRLCSFVEQLPLVMSYLCRRTQLKTKRPRLMGMLDSKV